MYLVIVKNKTTIQKAVEPSISETRTSPRSKLSSDQAFNWGSNGRMKTYGEPLQPTKRLWTSYIALGEFSHLTTHALPLEPLMSSKCATTDLWLLTGPLNSSHTLLHKSPCLNERILVRESCVSNSRLLWFQHSQGYSMFIELYSTTSVQRQGRRLEELAICVQISEFKSFCNRSHRNEIKCSKKINGWIKILFEGKQEIWGPCISATLARKLFSITGGHVPLRSADQG